MKTALNQLKERIKYRLLNKFRGDNDFTKGYESALESVIEEIEQLLPIERETIINARIDIGHYKGKTYDESRQDAEQYFNQTYNE